MQTHHSMEFLTLHRPSCEAFLSRTERKITAPVNYTVSGKVAFHRSVLKTLYCIAHILVCSHLGKCFGFIALVSVLLWLTLFQFSVSAILAGQTWRSALMELGQTNWSYVCGIVFKILRNASTWTKQWDFIFQMTQKILSRYKINL